ncbi:hypothetical protein HZB08_02185, partial [Candidatus Saganbacteria bacterium]|nr:hypothetical protein [Candidatus Saganbacteria bacterium]
MVKRILIWTAMLIVVVAAFYWNYDYSLWKKASAHNNRAADYIEAGE